GIMDSRASVARRLLLGAAPLDFLLHLLPRLLLVLRLRLFARRRRFRASARERGPVDLVLGLHVVHQHRRLVDEIDGRAELLLYLPHFGGSEMARGADGGREGPRKSR